MSGKKQSTPLWEKKRGKKVGSSTQIAYGDQKDHKSVHLMCTIMVMNEKNGCLCESDSEDGESKVAGQVAVTFDLRLDGWMRQKCE